MYHFGPGAKNQVSNQQKCQMLINVEMLMLIPNPSEHIVHNLKQENYCFLYNF